jgi:hypothetical protein
MQSNWWHGIFPFSFFGMYSTCTHAETGFANSDIDMWHVLYSAAVMALYCTAIIKPSYSGAFRMQLMLFAAMCVVEPLVFCAPFGCIWTWLPTAFTVPVVTAPVQPTSIQEHVCPTLAGQ